MLLLRVVGLTRLRSFGRSRGKRSLATVVGVDFHVVDAEVTGPDRRFERAAV